MASIPVFNCDHNKIRISIVVFKDHCLYYLTLSSGLTGRLKFSIHLCDYALGLFLVLTVFSLKTSAYLLILLRYSINVSDS